MTETAHSNTVNIELNPAFNWMICVAGQSSQQPISLLNLTSQLDYFDLSLEGLPADWYTFSAASVNLFPNWNETIEFKLTPPLQAQPGSYPVRLSAISRNDPTIRCTADLQIQIQIQIGDETEAAGSARQEPVMSGSGPVMPSADLAGQLPERVEIQLETTVLTRLPGETARLWIGLVNYTSLPDTFELTVEGWPTEWVSLSQTSLRLFPNWSERVELELVLPPQARPGFYGGRLLVWSQSRPGVNNAADLGLEVQHLATLARGDRPTGKLSGPYLPLAGSPGGAVIPNFPVEPRTVLQSPPTVQLFSPAELQAPLNRPTVQLSSPVESSLPLSRPTVQLFEAPPSIENRPEQSQNTRPPLEVSPPKNELLKLGLETLDIKVAAGGWHEQQLSMINEGDAVDVFELSVEGLPGGWASFSTASLNLFPNWHEKQYFRLDVPAETEPQIYTAQIKARSQAQSLTWQSLALSVEVLPASAIVEAPVTSKEGSFLSIERGQLELKLEQVFMSVMIGANSEQQLNIVNLTTLADNFDLKMQGDLESWCYFSSRSVNLFPGWDESLYLRIAVPAGTEPGRYDGRLQAASRSRPDFVAWADLTVEAILPAPVASSPVVWQAAQVPDYTPGPAGAMYSTDLTTWLNFNPAPPAGLLEMAQTTSLTSTPDQALAEAPPQREVSWEDSPTLLYLPTPLPSFPFEISRQYAAPSVVPAVEPISAQAEELAVAPYPPEAALPPPPEAALPPAPPKKRGWNPFRSQLKPASAQPDPAWQGNLAVSEPSQLTTQPVLTEVYQPHQPLPASVVGTAADSEALSASSMGEEDQELPPALRMSQLFTPAMVNAAYQPLKSTVTEASRVQVILQTARMTIVAGQEADQKLSLLNLTAAPDNFDLAIEGLPPNWYNFSSSSLNLFPNWSESVDLKVALSEKVRPDLYVGRVIVTSRTQPGVYTEVRLEIEVLAPLRMEARLQPHRAKGFRAKYDLVVRNRSMSEEFVALGLNGSNDFCRGIFEPPQVIVPAGKSVTIRLKVQLRPKTPSDQARQLQTFEVQASPQWMVAGQPMATEPLLVEGGYIPESRWAFLGRYPRLIAFGVILLLFVVLWANVILPGIRSALLLITEKSAYSGRVDKFIRIDGPELSAALKRDLAAPNDLVQVETRFKEAGQQVQINLKSFFVQADLIGSLEVNSGGNLVFNYQPDKKGQGDSFPWLFAPPKEVVDKLNLKLRAWLRTQQPPSKMIKAEIEGDTLFIRLAPCAIPVDPVCR